MSNPNIRIKRSAVPGKRPDNSQMELGELALNTNDGRLFTKKESVGIGTTVTLLNVWTENIGGGAYYNDGFVGIGTTNPTSRLQIQGDVLVSGVVTATAFNGDINSTGVNTATTISGTSLTYTDGSFSNLNVSGVTTTGILNVGVGGTVITTTNNGSVGIGTNTLLDTNNPGGLSILGKVLAGGSISSPNILNSVFPNTGTGHSAYRPLNLIDNSAAIKIVRTHNDFGPIVDLHQWNAGITTMISYWDIVAEQGTFSIRDRLGAYDNTKPQLSRLFINEYGNVLINASAQAIGPNKTQSVGYGTANVLQVNGNTFIGGNLGIGTTNPQQQVQVGTIGTSTGLVISGLGSIGITTTNPTTFIDITESTPTRNTVQFGSFGIQNIDYGNVLISNNGYWNGNDLIYRRNGHSSYIQCINGNFWFRAAPVGTAGSANPNPIDTRLSIQNNGNIGINTNNPRLRLHINDFGTSNFVGITSTGFVGIGTTNPQSKLHIENGNILVSTGTTLTLATGPGLGATSSGFTYALENPFTSVQIGGTVGRTGNALIDIRGSNYPDGTSIINIQTPSESYTGSIGTYKPFTPAGTVLELGNTRSNDRIGIGNTNFGRSAALVSIYAYNNNNVTNAFFGAVAGDVGNGPANFVFGRRTGAFSWQETVRIDTQGNLGVGTTNPTSKLQVQGDVLITGIATATDFNSASDLKLKENIQAIENPIDKILNINGVSFDWKETGKSSMGVIAQDVEKVLPELVNGTDSKTVNYNGLIGLLIEVVKEQQKEINILKEKLQ